MEGAVAEALQSSKNMDALQRTKAREELDHRPDAIAAMHCYAHLRRHRFRECTLSIFFPISPGKGYYLHSVQSCMMPSGGAQTW